MYILQTYVKVHKINILHEFVYDNKHMYLILHTFIIKYLFKHNLNNNFYVNIYFLVQISR